PRTSNIPTHSPPGGKGHAHGHGHGHGGGGGVSKYELVDSLNEQFDAVDYLWRRSKEKVFIRNLINARVHHDLGEFVDHLYYWSNVRPLDSVQTQLLRQPLEDVRSAVDFAAWEVGEKARIEAEVARREAKKKKGADKEDDSIDTGLRTSMEGDNTEGGSRKSLEGESRRSFEEKGKSSFQLKPLPQ
ncbi:hypothetical protein B484DRAFT_392766, partial [Ochromonadaceae sp. CCMP2298]